jgi:hypothetical protein
VHIAATMRTIRIHVRRASISSGVIVVVLFAPG